VFMFLSGANFVLHFHAIKGRMLGHYFKDPEFRFYAAVVLGMIALISANLFSEGRYVAFRDALRAAAFQVASIITTTGFISADYERWPYFSKSIICAGLFLGGCAGSTAGGIKQIRLLAMTNCVGQRLRKMLNPRAVLMVPIGSSTLEPMVMSSCMAFFGLYFMVFAAGAFAISLFEPDLMTSIAGAATALGNVGPAFGDLSATDNFAGQCPEAKWIFSFLMLCGRLELYTVFALFSGAFWREGIITGDGTD
ncbi:MAG: TrkH family potassium uptake protein, partial [Synergistaceae bacterium]|nr:TrkH family potassium uptake protein [Synergistaceae bacterium]